MISFPHRSEYNVANNPPWDRLTGVEDHRAEAMANWTDGAYPGGWIVTPGSGMSVLVSPGMGRIQGVFCYDEPIEGVSTPRTLVIQPADATYDRIDLIVVRKNDAQEYRSCDWYVVEGTPSAVPSPQFLTRDSEVYELAVAQVYIPKNSTGISAERITDLRLHSAWCGLSTTRVFDLAIEDIKALLDAAVDGTAAGNLQTQIDDIDAKCNVNKPLLVHASAATVNKGTIEREVVFGEEITLNMTYGNAAAAPTLTIAGVVHNIVGLPTTGRVNSPQTFKIRKTDSATLTFVTFPDYVCEYGTWNNFRYRRWASGDAECFMVASQSTGELTMEPIVSGGPYVSQDLFLSLPVGDSPLFNNAGYTALPSVFSRSYIQGIDQLYDVSQPYKLGYCVKKAGGSTSAVSFRFHLRGTWK